MGKKLNNVYKVYRSNIILVVVNIIGCIYINVRELILLDSNKIVDLINYNSIISGFLFTAISVLISALSNDRVNRLMKHGYLNKYFMAIILSLTCSIISIIINLSYLYINVDLIFSSIVHLQKAVISFTLVGSIFFIQAVYYIIKLMSKLLKK